MKKPIYSGVFLREHEFQRLRVWFERETGVPLLSESPKDPHMTSAFKPPIEEVAAMPLGHEVILTVTGWAADEKAQAVLVSGFPSDRSDPHITVAVAQGVAPAYSKELLARGHTSVRGISVRGTVGYFDGKVQFSWEGPPVA